MAPQLLGIMAFSGCNAPQAPATHIFILGRLERPSNPTTALPTAINMASRGQATAPQEVSTPGALALRYAIPPAGAQTEHRLAPCP